MKEPLHHYFRSGGLAALFCMQLLLVSCTEFYFSAPQPAGSENIVEFPDEYLGKWYSEDTGTYSIEFTDTLKTSGQQDDPGGPYPDHWGTTGANAVAPFAKKEDSSFIIINKKNIQLLFFSTDRIVTGAWPKLNKSSEFIYSGDNTYNWLRSIEYDSLKRPVDTLDNYLLYGNMIYEIDDKGYLDKGNPYVLDKDTIMVTRRDTICIDLGENAFLRKLDGRFHVLNIRSRVLGEHSPWWQFFILEKTSAATFKVWECSVKAKTLPSMFYPKSTRSDLFYFNCNWTEAEMMQLMKEEYFINTGDYFRKE